jgi:integrase
MLLTIAPFVLYRTDAESMAEYNYIRKTAWYNGKKYEATGKTEREAMTKLADKLSAAKRGDETVNENMKVDDWYKQWIEVYKKPKGLTAKSLGMYTEKYNKYIKPRIGNMKIKDVRDTHLQGIMNDQAGMSESHAKKVRMVLQELFKRARQSRMIVYDPAELLELPKTTKGQRRSITDEERSAILEVAKTHRSGFWIMTLLYTGMRPGETASLTWADVDFKKNEIRVHTAKESGSQAIKTPKTAAGIRVIPIHKELLPLLQKNKGKNFDPVFPTGEGNFQNENSLRRLWTGFKRDLDIYMGAETYRNRITKSVVAEDLVPYCLRHTFATDCAKSGVPIETVKWLMGHEDIATTANIYQHPSSDAIHQGMRLLESDGGKIGGKIENEAK